MINYTFLVNEEIARWVTEVYVKSNPHLGWWIAFTNPTAGPWKKIVAPSEEGVYEEIYRFLREGERPDLILVNDVAKTILIVEAKDYCSRIITSTQMQKSVRVINEITHVLTSCAHKNWGVRSKYKILPSFLWFCQIDPLEEHRLVEGAFNQFKSGSNTNDILNIIVQKDKNNFMRNIFIYENTVYPELDFLGS